MKVVSTNKELKRIMKQYSIDRTEMAKISGYSYGAVDHWLASPSAKRYNKLKASVLEFIKYKIKEMHGEDSTRI